MLKRDLAKNYIVYIFHPDPEMSATLKMEIAQGGFSCISFTDWQMLMNTMENEPPHLLYFSLEHFSGNLSPFVEKALRFNDDLRFIVHATDEQFKSLLPYSSHGLEWVITSHGEQALGQHLLWAVDKVCEKLYLRIQNETLLSELKAAKLEISNRPVVEKVEKVRESWFEAIKLYRVAASKEETLQVFFERMSSLSLIYFRFLPGAKSFVALNATGFNRDLVNGLGCKLEPNNEDISTALTMGMIPPELSNLLKSKLGLAEALSIPHVAMGVLEGLLIYPKALPLNIKNQISDEFSLMTLAYSFLCAEKRLDLIEMQDSVTEFFNLRTYLERLKVETARARRSSQALALVKISVDDFYEIEQTMGEAARDVLLKKISQIIRASARAGDILCRTALNEIALILPNCHRRGAMLRAERLRRNIEVSQSLLAGRKVSISVGISEYPSLCSHPDSLNQSASKALLYIQERGGNRICLYKAPKDHRPEFAVDIEAG